MNEVVQVINSEEAANAAKAFVGDALNYVRRGLETGTISPKKERFFKWQIHDFSYSQEGIKYSATGHEFEKDIWKEALRDAFDHVKETDQYRALLSILNQRYSGKNIEGHFLPLFLTRLTELVDAEINGKLIWSEDVAAARLISDLDGHPARYTGVAHLAGITLESSRVEISISDTVNVVLRQPTREDLEKEIGTSTFQKILSNAYFIQGAPRPSALLEVSYEDINGYQVLVQIERVVQVLRLFGVGSVKSIYCRAHSESMTDGLAPRVPTAPSMAHFDDKHSPSTVVHYISKADEDRLKLFLQKVWPHRESIFQFGKGRDYLKIAFDRYTASVLRDHEIEERIAHAVSGMEALLLKNEPELSYKFSLFGSMILAAPNRSDILNIRSTLKKLYSIRSKFFHGELLSPKEKKKIEEEYGSMEAIWKMAADYLRKLLNP